jgi:hypothetical protein
MAVSSSVGYVKAAGSRVEKRKQDTRPWIPSQEKVAVIALNAHNMIAYKWPLSLRLMAYVRLFLQYERLELASVRPLKLLVTEGKS